MPLTTVISGGQNGVDQAGVSAALEAGFKTGGVMPKGWITLDGPRPEFADLYRMKEHPTRSDYPPRTFENVRDSDATIRLFFDPYTRGEELTLKAIRQYRRPHLDVDLRSPPDPKVIAIWIVRNDYTTLNIAGNSERTKKGIFDVAREYLVKVFTLVHELEAGSAIASDDPAKRSAYRGVEYPDPSRTRSSDDGIPEQPGVSTRESAGTVPDAPSRPV